MNEMVDMAIILEEHFSFFPNNSKITDVQDNVNGDIDRWENDGGSVLNI